MGYTLGQYFKTKLPNVLYFSLVAFILVVHFTVSLLGILNAIPSLLTLFAILYTLTGPLTFGMMIIFFESFEGKLSLKKTGLSIAGMSVIGYMSIISFIQSTPELVTQIIVIHELTFFQWSILATPIANIIFLAMTIWVYLILRESRENAINNRQEQQIRIMNIGFFFAVILVFIVAIPGSISIFVDEDFLFVILIHLIQPTLLAVGFAIIAYGYFSVNQVAFLQPQKFESLIVIEETGIPILRYDFDRSDEDDVGSSDETSLVSGAITAITALMTEAFGVSTNIKSIEFYDKELAITFREGFAFILITSRITEFANNSLFRFADIFEQKYIPSLEEGQIQNKIIENAKEDLEKSFGFRSLD